MLESQRTSRQWMIELINKAENELFKALSSEANREVESHRQNLERLREQSESARRTNREQNSRNISLRQSEAASLDIELEKKRTVLESVIAAIERDVQSQLVKKREDDGNHDLLVTGIELRLSALEEQALGHFNRYSRASTALEARQVVFWDDELHCNGAISESEIEGLDSELSALVQQIVRYAPSRIPFWPRSNIREFQLAILLAVAAGLVVDWGSYATGSKWFTLELGVLSFMFIGWVVRNREKKHLRAYAFEFVERLEKIRAGLSGNRNSRYQIMAKREAVAQAELSRNRDILANEIQQLRQQYSVSRAENESRHAAKEKELEARASEIEAESNRAEADETKRHDDNVASIRQRFTVAGAKVTEELAAYIREISFSGEPWNSSAWGNWKPALSPNVDSSIGRFAIERGGLPFSFPGFPTSLRIPALVGFQDGSALFVSAETNEEKEIAVGAVQGAALRLLANIPPGKLRFTFIDPVGLGHNAAPFMPLGDFEESLISSRAWTHSIHIEQRLAELTEHMETVIQKYLRTEYNSIHDYNNAAQEVAEAYRVLVVFDFPWGFTTKAAEHLVSIVQKGARCGVSTIILHDPGKSLPHGFRLEDVTSHATVVNIATTAIIQGPLANRPFVLDSAPPGELTQYIVKSVGESAKAGMRVQVGFEKLLKMAGIIDGRWWADSTAPVLNVPLGPRGAQKLQFLTMGDDGTAHHALVVGRTGSGKTNLIHVLIAALAVKYSPKEIQLYLVDFKGGVGFKPYAQYRFPHAAVIAIESEREFGLSVLLGAESEMLRRGELFRSAGVNNITDFRSRSKQLLPRVLLIFDEFQVLFSEDDSLAQRAKQIVEGIVRQGRGFGVHILLSSQSLTGSASLPQAIVDQMAIRIALQCSDADARLILAHDNPVAKTLSRAGEAIYNSAAGLIEGNSPFQAAYLPDDILCEYLARLSEMATSHNYRGRPIVFEGNESAELAECQHFTTCGSVMGITSPPRDVKVWLGEATTIRPAVSVSLRKQSGRHLLIVDRLEEQGTGVLVSAWLSLLTLHGPTTCRFVILDYLSTDSPSAGFVEHLQNAFPHQIELLNRRALAPFLTSAEADIKKRLDNALPDGQTVYFLINGLQKARDLKRNSDYFPPADQTEPDIPKLFFDLLRDGPEVGYHVLAYSDSVVAARRILDRSLSEFGIRIAGSMAADDSRSLLDDARAAKLATSHRMLVYDEDQPGTLEKIRPYRPASLALIQQLASRCRSRVEV